MFSSDQIFQLWRLRLSVRLYIRRRSRSLGARYFSCGASTPPSPPSRRGGGGGGGTARRRHLRRHGGLTATAALQSTGRGRRGAAPQPRMRRGARSPKRWCGARRRRGAANDVAAQGCRKPARGGGSGGSGALLCLRLHPPPAVQVPPSPCRCRRRRRGQTGRN